MRRSIPVKFDFRHPTPDKSKVIFPVKVANMSFSSLKDEETFEGDRGVSVVRMDSKKIICHASSDYQLITHKSVLDTVEAMFKSNSIKFKLFDVKTGGSKGNRMYVNYTLPGYNFDVKGDKFTPFVQIQNSYDLSLKYGMVTGVYRMACTNGLVLLRNTKVLAKKHTHENIDLVEVGLNIDKFVDALGIAKTSFEHLLTKKITKKDIEEIPELVFSRKRDVEVFKNLKLVDQYTKELGKNQYALMNALTAYTSHVLDSYNENHDYTKVVEKRIAKLFLN